VEIFAGVDHLVVESHVDLLILGITGVYAVNKCVAEDIFIFDPSLESISEIPELGILEHAFFEICAVLVDKLAGKEDETGESELKSLVEKLSQLAGEALCGSVLDLVVLLKADTCLGGVGNNKTEIGILGERQISVEIVVGLNATGDNVDLLYVHSLTSAAEVSVLAILRLKQVAKTPFNGLDHYYLTVKIGFFIDNLKHPIGKAAKKTALAELYNSFFHFCLRSAVRDARGKQNYVIIIIHQKNTKILKKFDYLAIFS
jgi:hypothetical protein